MNNFWDNLDELLAQSKIVIDRPKGSAHPRYPQIVYELDYGYIDGTKSSDNEGMMCGLEQMQNINLMR